MYQQIIGIQCISIILVLIECWVIFKNWKGILHSYLFLSCAAILVNNVGYLMEITSGSEEAFFNALKLSYFGRVWITFALFLFLAELVNFKIPRPVKIALALSNLFTYIAVVTTKETNLYYKNISFEIRGHMPVLVHQNAIVHYLWDVILAVCTIFGLYLLIKALLKERKPIAKKRFIMVLLAIVTLSFFLIIETFSLVPATAVYDMTMVGYPISSIFILIAIFRYRLLDAETLARRFTIDELSEGVIAVDEDENLTYYNKPASIIFPELRSNPAGVIAQLKLSIATDTPIEIDEKIYSPEEKELISNNEKVGTVYAVIDDTEHFKYMAELEEQKSIADNANKAKSKFLARMSHEIRTPINAVLGMDEMILRESHEKEILAYAADIRSAGKTLLSLINDILDFSKIEEGKMEIIPTQYELSSVINDLVNIVRYRAEKKGLKLNVDVEKHIPHLLYGDDIRIKQVAINLLTNAVKYTDKGFVCLTVDYSRVSDKEIDLSFDISDTGVGLKPEDMEKLFSPFTRIDEKHHRTTEGTGLGMSIVQQLLELMGSQLQVKSVYGEGSDFSFTIRQKVISWEEVGNIFSHSEKEEQKHQEYKELFHAPEARILVVDDTEVNLAVVKNLLKKTQIPIDTAASGTEAIRKFKNNSYDIVFIDHMMPDMDGVETLTRMKELEGADSTTFIIFTANAVSGARQMYLNAGFEDYLSKPVDGRRLEEIILRYLPNDKVLAPSEIESEAVSGALIHQKSKVLVIDDDEVICATVSQILGKSFDVFSCNDALQAEKEAVDLQPDLILLDLNLGGKSGFEILHGLKKNVSTSDIPVMFLTADEDRENEALGLKNGALDFIRKPVVPEVLLQRSKRIIALDRFQKDLQGEVRKQSHRAERISREMMLALSHTVDAKDHYTKGHSERVAAYAAEIGRRLGKDPEEQRRLYEIGLLHDIGKIGIPEDIINKTERLSEAEFAQIKTHTVIGYEILKGIGDMQELSQGARSHHERYDGRGYPDGLEGSNIPEVARIICVADCYDAMTSTRTYSVPKPQEKVRGEFERCSGYQFDPEIAQIMIAMIDEDVNYDMNERKAQGSVWKNKEAYWDRYDSDAPTSSGSIAKISGAAVSTPVSDEIDNSEWLRNINGLDIEHGITNCGSFESLVSVVKVFHKTAASKAKEIEDLLASGDIENYTIKVHALKSSARIIGATILSDLAKELEAAGKAADQAKIESDTPTLLSMYRELDTALSGFDEEEKEKPELSDDMRKEAFQTMEEVAQAMDYGMMEQVLKDLKGYSLSEADTDLVKELEALMMQLDWDEILELVKLRE